MRQTMLAAKGLVWVAFLFTCAYFVPAGRTDDKIEEKLNKPVLLDKSLEKETSLKEAMELVSKRHDLNIVINGLEFKKQLKIFNIEQFPVRLEQMRGMPVRLQKKPVIHLGLIIELLAKQVDGTYEIKRDHIEIVPLQPGKRNPAPPLKMSKEETGQLDKKMQKPVSLGKGIDMNTPLQDVVEFLSDSLDIVIILDSSEFKRSAKVDNVTDLPITLPPQKRVPVKEILEQVAKQVNGTCEIKGGVVVIVPEKEDKR
jgi:hypothetical protein